MYKCHFCTINKWSFFVLLSCESIVSLTSLCISVLFLETVLIQKYHRNVVKVFKNYFDLKTQPNLRLGSGF